MRREVIAAVMAVLTVAGLTALAQEQGIRPGNGPRPGGPRAGGGEMMGRVIDRLATDPKAAEDLGLTDEQVAHLKAKAEEMKAGREATMNKLRAAEEKQRALMQAETLDEAVLLKGLDEVGALRIEMSKADLKAMIAVRSILTPDQMNKLREQARERMQGQRMQGGGEQRRGSRGNAERGQRPPPPPEPPSAPAE